MNECQEYDDDKRVDISIKDQFLYSSLPYALFCTLLINGIVILQIELKPHFSEKLIIGNFSSTSK